MLQKYREYFLIAQRFEWLKGFRDFVFVRIHSFNEVRFSNYSLTHIPHSEAQLFQFGFQWYIRLVLSLGLLLFQDFRFAILAILCSLLSIVSDCLNSSHVPWRLKDAAFFCKLQLWLLLIIAIVFNLMTYRALYIYILISIKFILNFKFYRFRFRFLRFAQVQNAKIIKLL